MPVRKVSGDIRALMDFELQRGKEVFNFGGAVGYYCVELRDPFHDREAGFTEAVGNSLHPWSWADRHYEEAYDGFKSEVFPSDLIVVRRRSK